MQHQKLLRLAGFARHLLGQELSCGSHHLASTTASTSYGHICPVLSQQRNALRRLHTSRLLAMAGEPEAGGRAGARDVAPVSMRTLILMLMAGAGVTYATRLYTDQKLQKVVAQSQQVVGKAAVGGPFDLIDHDGKRFTDKDLLGEFALLYFGFTHCPDICPDELEKLSEAINSVEKSTGVQIQPVFISVDPERDKPALVKAYVREFHPRMIGLTGDLDNVKAVSKAYRVYYSKTGESDTDYLVDHSIIHYLVNPEGEFVTFFGKNNDAPTLAKLISQHLADWQKEHPGYHRGRGTRRRHRDGGEVKGGGPGGGGKQCNGYGSGAACDAPAGRGGAGLGWPRGTPWWARGSATFRKQRGYGYVLHCAARGRHVAHCGTASGTGTGGFPHFTDSCVWEEGDCLGWVRGLGRGRCRVRCTLSDRVRALG